MSAIPFCRDTAFVREPGCSRAGSGGDRRLCLSILHPGRQRRLPRLVTPRLIRAVFGSLCLSLFSPVLPALIVTSGTIAVAAGGAFLDGDQPAFQQRMRERKDGYGGIESFTWSRTTDNDSLRFDARAFPGSEDYLFSGRWEKFDAYYIEANYKQFR